MRVRLSPEIGSETADVIFEMGGPHVSVATYLAFAEVCATLRRKRNAGTISEPSFRAARLNVEIEVLRNPTVIMLSVDDQAMVGGVALCDQHGINASDAASLYSLLRYARAARPSAIALMVATDQRLLRAARAEGLGTVNPETLDGVEARRLIEGA